MLTQKELDAAVRKMIANLDEVNLYFIQKIATQIKKIGEMNPTSIHRYTIMLEMGADIADISGKLQAATRLTQQQMAVVYNAALQDNFTDPRFKAALAAHPLPREENQRLVQYTRNIAAQTSGALQNLSNTTAISVPYQQAIDKAILSVSTGMTDYKSAMRQTIKDIGWAGMQVQYASGYHRRLDTAARQNIIDGACQIAQHSADEIGKALGYDAVELSAHLNSAPDHEPVQGHIFLLAEYAKMQAGMACVDVNGHHFAGFKRPIGEWNAGALMLHCLVGGAQGIVFVLDGRGHVAGQNLRRIVVDSRRGHDLGPQGCAGAGAAFADQAERVRQHRRVGGMLAQRFGPGAAHQAPPCNVFHAAEQRTERIGFHLHLTSGLWYTGVAFSIPQLFEM